MAKTEQDIFNELAGICRSPGYVHAIAILCFQETIIHDEEGLAAKDIYHLYNKDPLTRTEIATLIGLVIQAPISYALPDTDTLQYYLDRTRTLLAELHKTIIQEANLDDIEKLVTKSENPFQKGDVLREAIFYGGDSAYSFQYESLSLQKYAKDEQWLQDNKSFTIAVAKNVIQGIWRLQNKKSTSYLQEIPYSPSSEYSPLSIYVFTAQEISEQTGIDVKTIEHVLKAFTLPADELNKDFRGLHDLNLANVYPIINKEHGSFLLLQGYSLAEALYEAPFYWMGKDNTYISTANKNRGQFTENFSKTRLELIFGKEHVYTNIDVHESKDKKLGEIDVLVVLADRAIVLQAKSKRLTLEARKGNDKKIKDDFRKSIQDSYSQSLRCAEALNKNDCKLVTPSQNELAIPRNFREIYILCVVADHYPALSFQTQQFLEYKQTEIIQPPWVLDLFALDSATEMLQSPLRFLVYLNQRTKYAQRIAPCQESTILSYYLTHNLYLNDETDMIMLSNQLSADLDASMAVRRLGIPGKHTPDGILTRFVGTPIGDLIKDIEMKTDPGAINIGFTLLTMSEDAVRNLNQNIIERAAKAHKNGKSCNITIDIGSAAYYSGLTIHCNNFPPHIAKPALRQHCIQNKYAKKAKTWAGICLNPTNRRVRFWLSLEYRWIFDAALAEITKSALTDVTENSSSISNAKHKTKIGRNTPCPCGSGLKHKKCCLR